MLCLAAGMLATSLALGDFTLAWTHSVEKTEWREHWRIEDGALRLLEARVKGSGAGMDPGAGARLEDGWWVWTPQLPPVPELVLARSGATADWRLCDAAGGDCRDLAAIAGPDGPDAPPLVLRPCP